MLELALLESNSKKYGILYMEWVVATLLASGVLIVGYRTSLAFFTVDGIFSLLLSIGMAVHYYRLSEEQLTKSVLVLTTDGFSVRHQDGRRSKIVKLASIHRVDIPIHISGYHAQPDYVAFDGTSAMIQQYDNKENVDKLRFPLRMYTQEGLYEFRTLFRNRKDVSTFKQIMNDWNNKTRITMGNVLPSTL